MANFTVDKSSGVGPGTIKVKPSGINLLDTQVTNILNVTVGNTTKTVRLIQKANTNPREYQYTFTSNKSSVSAEKGSSQVSIVFTSNKQLYVGTTIFGSPETVGYKLTSNTAGSWAIYSNGVITIGANTGAERSGTLVFTQDESGKTIEIKVSQASGEVVTYEYTFSVKPTSATPSADGGSISLTVTSTRQKMVNGVASGSPETVGYSATDSSVWAITTQSNPTSITVTKNTSTSPRSTTITLNQNYSGKTAKISITQSGAEPETVYHTLSFVGLDQEHTYYLFDGYSAPQSGSIKFIGFTSMDGTHDETWIDGEGLLVNDSGNAGKTTHILPGNSVTLYMGSGEAVSGEVYYSVKVFTLEAGNQTVAL